MSVGTNRVGRSYYYRDTTRIDHGYHEDTTQVVHGGLCEDKLTAWVAAGYYTSSVWVLLGKCMGTTQVACGYYLGSTCVLPV